MDKFKYTPINELFANRVCSKPTFYKYLKEGRFPIYKFGRRSYVDLLEFQAAFTKVTFPTCSFGSNEKKSLLNQ